MKKINIIINIFIAVFIGVFIGHGVYTVCYWCIYWTRGLYCLGLQNSSRIIRCAISTVVYKHLDIWCIDHYFVTDLHCDKSDHQS